MPGVTLDWQLPLPMLDAPQRLPAQPGVYVLSLLRAGCYYAHYVGKSDSSISDRIGRHIACYTKGEYWLHDIDETERQDRLGRPLYSANSQFDTFMQDLAQQWISALQVFHAIVLGNIATPKQVEGAVAWALHGEPRRCFTRFYDFCHEIVLNRELDLTHSFQGPRIEGF